MKQFSVVLIFVLALARTTGTPATASLLPEASADTKNNDSSDRWAAENYHRAVDVVLPDRCAVATDARWLACIRIVPPFRNELEYSLSVHKQFDGTVTAQITRPKLHSIYDQLRERKKENTHARFGELVKLIEVESQKADQRGFPRLVDLATAFENLRVSPVLSDEIMMDPTEYDVRVRSFAGESLQLTLDGPGSGAPHQSQPLIRWAESVRELLTQSFQ